ncbi:MAG: HAD family hydrolase [Planctomycetia bacterium]|nr:HAD family hydrolase [Planctomycetia bacterium]
MPLRLFSHDDTPHDDDGINASPRFQKVRGIVFDMGDVLFDATVWRRWLLQQLHRMGLQTTYRSFFQVWDRDYLDAVHRGERDYAEAFHTFLRDTGLTESQVDEVILASNRQKRDFEQDVRPFPGVRATLERLHANGLRLAVLSDSESPAEAIEPRLAQMGIGRYFSAVVSSADLKQTKPAGVCYRTAIERLRLAPAQTAFVGHDAEELIGARRAGMPAVAIHYERDAVAEVFLHRFEELLQLFETRLGDESAFREAA